MADKKFYVECLISEAWPTETGFYDFCFNDSGSYDRLYWSATRKKLFRYIENDEVRVVPYRWLKPIAASGTPSAERMAEIADEYSGVVGCNDAERVRFVHGMETMAKELTPALAALTAERDDFKNRATKAMTENSDLIMENKALSEERDRMKERIQELETGMDEINSVAVLSKYTDEAELDKSMEKIKTITRNFGS